MEKVTVSRLHLKTLRREYLVSVNPLSWDEDEYLAKRFDYAKKARPTRAALKLGLPKHIWRVSIRPFGKADVVPRPVLTTVDWSEDNTTLGTLYNVSPPTIANWRKRAGKPPAPHGGARPGAGRRPEA